MSSEWFAIVSGMPHVKSSLSATSLNRNLSMATERGVVSQSELGKNPLADNQHYKKKKRRKTPKKRKSFKALECEAERNFGINRLNESHFVSDNAGSKSSVLDSAVICNDGDAYGTSMAPTFPRFADNSVGRQSQTSLVTDSVSNVFASIRTVDVSDHVESTAALPCKRFCASSDGRLPQPTVLCDPCQLKKIKKKKEYNQRRRARSKARARIPSVSCREFDAPSSDHVQSTMTYRAASNQRTRSVIMRPGAVTHHPQYGAQNHGIAVSTPFVERPPSDPNTPTANAKQFRIGCDSDRGGNDRMFYAAPLISPLTALPFQTDGWSRMCWPSDATFVPSHFSGFSSCSSSSGYRSSSSTAPMSTSRPCTSAAEVCSDRLKTSQFCQTDEAGTSSTGTQTELDSTVGSVETVWCIRCSIRSVIPSSVECGRADGDGVNSVTID